MIAQKKTAINIFIMWVGNMKIMGTLIKWRLFLELEA
jgi:hypothetical protein